MFASYKDAPESEARIKYLHGHTHRTSTFEFEQSDLSDNELSLQLSEQLRKWIQQSRSPDTRPDISEESASDTTHILAVLRALLVESDIDWDPVAQFLDELTDAASKLDREVRFHSFVAFLVLGPTAVKVAAARALAAFGEGRAIPHIRRIIEKSDDKNEKTLLRGPLERLENKVDRKQRYHRALELLDAWEEEDADYGRRAWPEIKRALREDPIRLREPED